LGGDRTSRIPAHESSATVAPFRAWRGSQRIVAGEPARPPLSLSLLRPKIYYCGLLSVFLQAIIFSNFNDGHLAKKINYLSLLNTNLPKEGKITKVHVTIQNMPTVMTNPMLAMP